MKNILALVILTSLLACTFAFSGFNHDFVADFRNIAHKSRINHNLRRFEHLPAVYTKAQQKFLKDFQGQMMGLVFSNPEIMAAMFSGQPLTAEQNQTMLNNMLGLKDFPRFMALSMRNETQNAWIAKLSPANQLKFVNIIIDQMKKSKSMEMGDDSLRRVIQKVLNDKALAVVFVNSSPDVDIKQLTDQAEFAKLQAKYPALKKIDPKKKISDDNKILILKTLIADDEFWKQLSTEINTKKAAAAAAEAKAHQ